MIDAKYQRLVYAFFMVVAMTCIMSFVITVHNVGFIPNLLQVWLKAWGFAFIVAFPTVLFLAPVMQKLVAKLVK